MYGTLNNYLASVQHAWTACDGECAAALLSLKDEHIMNPNLYIESPEAAVQRVLEPPMDEVVIPHLRALYYLGNKNDTMNTYKEQIVFVMAIVKVMQQQKDENWFLPIMYTGCLDLRVLALKCEKLNKTMKPGQLSEKAAECLMSCFRVCAADGRSTSEDTKRLGMMYLVNQLFKVYFRINKLHLCKPLIRAIDSSPFKDEYPLPEQITYKYFAGRKAMFDSEYKTAADCLEFAMKHCPYKFANNKRLIMICLVPVKMLLGFMPCKEILARCDVLQFYDLTLAVKEGNILKFNEVVQRHEMFFIKTGVYLVVERLKFIVYRNLFKRVWHIRQTHQLNLEDFLAALKFAGESDMTIEETHCIVSNLVFDGIIKGYISLSHKKLVVSKQNPFPPLNTVS